jgi:hypothetical protein
VRLLLGHLRTGAIVAELDADAEFTDELSAPGMARATIALDAIPAGVDVRAVTAPWRHFLALDHGGTIVWAGPVVTRRRAPNTASIELGASGLWAVFDHRVLARLGDWPYTDPRADLVLTYRSLPGVALDIVRAALERPAGELPLVLPRLNSSGDYERRYYGHELASAGERLRQLTADQDGPDLHFHPRYQADRAGIEWVFRVGQPVLTQPGAVWHFDDGGNLTGYGFDEDNSVQASTVLVPGDGMERGRVIGTATDLALPDVGWPALDTVIQDHASEKQPRVLNAHAAAYLAAYRTGVTRHTAIVRTDIPPRLGTYLPGDHVVITPQADTATPPGERVRRITAIAHRTSNPTTAELTLAPAPASL